MIHLKQTYIVLNLGFLLLILQLQNWTGRIIIHNPRSTEKKESFSSVFIYFLAALFL